MRLPFLDRAEELSRLRRLFSRREPGLAVLYGRRRVGKSRLLIEALPERSAYYVADDREASIQRTALAREIGRAIDGFDRVVYPDWDALLEALSRRAPRGMVVAIDELPALVAVAPELPSLLQKYVDRGSWPHLALSGSSQRMMQGLALDRTAPLFGRAQEILRISPLPCGWLEGALELGDEGTIEAYSVWGGLPRYWELAADFATLWGSVEALVLSPLGVLHEEPAALLIDDLREPTQAASILSVIGQGAHRLSEIAGRLGKPATSLSRPLERLLGLGLVRRDVPFAASPKDSKRSLYRIADPFLRFWFRYVDADRSRLEARRLDEVAADVRLTFAQHVSGVWEDLVRESVARKPYFGRRWRPGSSWWGAGRDKRPLEIDVVAESEDGTSLLIGEAKWVEGADFGELARELTRKALAFPLGEGRRLFLGLWAKGCPRTPRRGVSGFGARHVLSALR